MKSLIKKISFISAVLVLFFPSCETDIIDKQPLDRLSTENFWNTENDANMALAGVYNRSTAWTNDGWIVMIDAISDNGTRAKLDEYPFSRGLLTPTSSEINSYWNTSYRQITAYNNFLENIDKVNNMKAGEKAEMIAEVRFLRAFTYYNISQWWGGVPLVTTMLSMDEANSVVSDTKESVVNFVLKELTEIAPDLPATRPSGEHGRIVKGAAYAIKGRLLMSEEDWSGAAKAFKDVIDLQVHNIDPDFREIFNGKKEQSTEIIFSKKYLENEITHRIQLNVRPNMDGGWHQVNPYQDLVDAYLCIDGKTIEESELYDPENPVVKDGVYYRDPRLMYTIYYPALSILNGKVYHGHPDFTSTGDEVGEDPGMTGYAVRKWIDETYTGDVYAGGNDIPIVRYAEVLLSYLECKIKNNDPITQDLLDQTINLVRTRESVNMPVVEETDRTELWEILKRERRIELAWEGLRYWDLIRWGDAHEVLNRPFYGMKLTDDPLNYDKFRIGLSGHYYVTDLIFNQSDLPWPFPQDELDINSNLKQKDNWK